MDTNNFDLTNPQISSITYIDGSFVITSGEAFQLPPTFQRQGSSATWEFTVKADRKNSSPVADSFINASGGAGHQYADTFIDEIPEELNFYFGTVVTFLIDGQSIPVTLYFGQGHRGTRNNWWIGGQGVQNNGNPEPLLQVTNGTVGATYRIDADISSMTLILI